MEQGARNKEHGARSMEQGAWSKEQGARGKGLTPEELHFGKRGGYSYLGYLCSVKRKS